MSSIREAIAFNLRGSFNSVFDVLLAKPLGVNLKSFKALSIRLVCWFSPKLDWIKLNTYRVAQGSPGVVTCGWIFRNCMGFVKSCFSSPLPVGFAFEAELQMIILMSCFSSPLPVRFAFEAKLQMIILGVGYAWEHGWNNIWFEVDLDSYGFPCSWSLCLFWLSRMMSYVSHIYKEGHIAINKLASLGLHQGI